MITETLLVCVTIYALVSPITYSFARKIAEQANKLELENDEYDYNRSRIVSRTEDEVSRDRVETV